MLSEGAKIMIILTQQELSNSANLVIEQLAKEDNFVCFTKKETDKGPKALLDDVIRGLHIKGKLVPKEKRNANDLLTYVKEQLGDAMGAILLIHYNQVPGYPALNALATCVLINDHLLAQQYCPSNKTSKTQTNIYVEDNKLCYEHTITEIKLANGETLPGILRSLSVFDPDKQDFVLLQIECGTPELKAMLIDNNFGAYPNIKDLVADKKAEQKLTNRRVTITSHHKPSLFKKPPLLPLRTENLPKAERRKSSPAELQTVRQSAKVFSKFSSSHLQMLEQITKTQTKQPPIVNQEQLFYLYDNVVAKYEELRKKISLLLDPHVTKQKLSLLSALKDSISELYERSYNTPVPLQQLKNLIINAAIANVEIDSQKELLPQIKQAFSKQKTKSEAFMVTWDFARDRKDEEFPENSKKFGVLGEILAGACQKVKKYTDTTVLINTSTMQPPTFN